MDWSKLKLWHLILFYLFFSFVGSLIALYSGAGGVIQNIIKVCSSLLFIGFLIFLIPDIKKYIFTSTRAHWLSQVVIGLAAGILLWYTMVLFQPFTALFLSQCDLGICNDLLQRFYSDTSTINYFVLSWELVVTMVFMFVIVGPIREEILYRTAMLLVMHRRYSLVACTIIIALIFAAFHLRYFIFSIGFSLMLSALVVRFRSILAAAIAHGTYNGMIYFLFPSIEIIGHHSNLGFIDITLMLFLLGNIYFWSVYSIRKNSAAWLANSGP